MLEDTLPKLLRMSFLARRYISPGVRILPVFVALGQCAPYGIAEVSVVGYVDRASGANHAYSTAVALLVQDFTAGYEVAVDAEEITGCGVDERPVAQIHIVEVGI